MKTRFTDFRCRVCDRDFPAVKLPGNHGTKRLICSSCRELHKWCNHCSRPRLLSDFAKSSRQGHQSRCNECLIDQRGNNRLRKCSHCDDVFILRTHDYYNGKGPWLCSSCRPNVKWCNHCETLKDRSKFNAATGKAGGRAAFCKSCNSERWKASPREVRAKSKLRQYRLTPEEYDAMLSRQNGLCAICNQPETDRAGRETMRSLAVDHNHATGVVRELLCGKCNRAIGSMLEDPVRLRAAADYLDKWST